MTSNFMNIPWFPSEAQLPREQDRQTRAREPEPPHPHGAGTSRGGSARGRSAEGGDRPLPPHRERPSRDV